MKRCLPGSVKKRKRFEARRVFALQLHGAVIPRIVLEKPGMGGTDLASLWQKI